MCQPLNNLAFKEDFKNRFNCKRRVKNSRKSIITESQIYKAKLLKEENCEATESSLKTVTDSSSRQDTQPFNGEFNEHLDKKGHESSPKEISESLRAAACDEKAPQLSKTEVCESQGTVLSKQETSDSWGKDTFLVDTLTLATDSPDKDVRESSQREVIEPSREETSKLSEVQLCLIRASKSLEGETNKSTAMVSTEEGTDSTEKNTYESLQGEIREFSHDKVSETGGEVSKLLEGEVSEAKASELFTKKATESTDNKDHEISQGEISESLQEDVTNFSDGETCKSLEEEASDAKANELSMEETTESPKDKIYETSQGEFSESSEGAAQKEQATKEQVWESKGKMFYDFWQRKIFPFLRGVSTNSTSGEVTDSPEEEHRESLQEEINESSQVEISESSEGAAQEEQATRFYRKDSWELKGKAFSDEETNFSWQRKIFHFWKGASTKSMSGEATDSLEKEYRESSQGEISDPSKGKTQEERATRFSKEEVWQSKETVFYDNEANYSWQRKTFHFLEVMSTQSMSGEATDSPEEEYLGSSEGEISESSEEKDSESSEDFCSPNSDIDTSVGNATLPSLDDTLSSNGSSDGTSPEGDSRSFESLSDSSSSDASTTESSSKSLSQKNGYFRCRIYEMFDKVSRGMKGAFCLQASQED